MKFSVAFRRATPANITKRLPQPETCSGTRALADGMMRPSVGTTSQPYRIPARTSIKVSRLTRCPATGSGRIKGLTSHAVLTRKSQHRLQVMVKHSRRVGCVFPPQMWGNANVGVVSRTVALEIQNIPKHVSQELQFWPYCINPLCPSKAASWQDMGLDCDRDALYAGERSARLTRLGDVLAALLKACCTSCRSLLAREKIGD
ncbi:hypothetical protein FB567DRAFT_59505 [Paraphoma chrysanthemicola]|uniref:Uncharacterized protein n=1 Tax=Paraphoma chrysanthemicola TaxID=798071 RepID=A0A8K0R7Y4_9PLEO|nr:hypothetical protein FB567DRAFT_59505 [Paraphoma chrysanthemicola]